MNILVLVVIAILILNAFYGLKAGFIKTVFSIFSMILALILTLIISPYVSKALQKNEGVMNYFSEKTQEVLNLDEIEGQFTDKLVFINNLPLPDSFKTTLLENNNEDTYGALGVEKNDFAGYVSYSVASIVVNALAFVITYLVILIGLRIISTVLDIVSKLPILNQINKLAGLVTGLLQGLIVVWLLFVLLTIFSSTDLGKTCFEMIDESIFLKELYNNNLILKFVTNLSGVLF